MEGETPNSVDNPETPAQGPEQVSNTPETQPPMPAPETPVSSSPPAENPAEVQAKIDEANRRLDEAYAENAPVSEPAGVNRPDTEAVPMPEATQEPAPTAPAGIETQPSAEPKPEPEAPPQNQEPASAAEQQNVMSEAETAATGRIEAIGEKNLTDEEKVEIERIWKEGGPDRVNKLNEIASIAEQREAEKEASRAAAKARVAEGERRRAESEAAIKERDKRLAAEKAAEEREEKKAREEAEKAKAEKAAGEKPEAKPEKPGVEEKEGDKTEGTKPEETAEDSISLHSLQKRIEQLSQVVSSIADIVGDAAFIRNRVEDLLSSGRENVRERDALRELVELFSERERLTERVTGKSITEIMAESERKVARILGYSTREDYVKALSPIEENRVKVDKEQALINQEWEKLSKRQQKKYGNHPEIFRAKMLEHGKKMGLSEDEYFGLLNAGYKPEKKKGFLNIGRSLYNTFALPFNLLRFSRGNFGRSERRVVMPNGKKAWIRTGDFKMIAETEAKNYNDGIADDARKQLGEKWGNEVKRQTEEFMEKEADDLEGAIERARGGYREARMNMLSRYLMGLRERPGSARVRGFDAKSKPDCDLRFFYEHIAKRTGKLGDINGDPERNSEAISGFLGDYGVDVSPGRVASRLSGGRYERAMKEEGLLSLIMDFVKNVAVVLKVKPSKRPIRRRPLKGK